MEEYTYKMTMEMYYSILDTATTSKSGFILNANADLNIIMI